MPVVTVRPRRPEDIPVLTEVLWEQQPTSRYPFRNPLPIPIVRFLHVDDALGAWTAEVDGRPVGHAVSTGAPRGFPGAEEMNEACALAHGCEVRDLAWVSSLFVSLDCRRLGIGRRLLGVVVADMQSSGLHPCLEMLAVHPAAAALYESSGWRTVMQTRPGWLLDAGPDVPDVQVMVLPSASAVVE